MNENELDERKTKILNAIIRNYLETGEPVGSRTISKYTDLNLSSATIRNEMSDLEEMGYILQPHTSAGRIPSDKGYRFYVDNLIAEKDKEVSDMKEFVIEHTKFIQLSNVDDEHILAVVVLEGNLVKNKMIPIEEPIDNEHMLKLNMLLNTHLNGLSLDQINLGTIAVLKEKAGIHSKVISDVLDAVAEAISEDEDLEIYTSGATNILKYPELSDSQKAGELLDALEEKKQLVSLVTDNLSNEENGIQVYIGDESPIQTMKDCSVVTATYELGKGVKGTIGIIGPKRMDYENVMDNLKNLKSQLEGIFDKPKKE